MTICTMLKRKRSSCELPSTTECNNDSRSEHSICNEIFIKRVNKPWWTPYVGIVYVIFGSTAILISNVFVKKLNYIDPSQLSMIRNLGLALGSLPFTIYSKESILARKKHLGLLIFRSFIVATAIYLNILSYRFLPIMEATIILATVPSLVTIFAKIYLKEPCGFVQITSIFLTGIGIIISIRIHEISQADGTARFTKDYNTGLACSFTCAFTLAFSFVSLRVLKDEHFSIVLLYTGVLGAIENGIITVSISSFSWCRCFVWDSVQTLLMGILGFVGHYFIVIGLQTEMASVFSICKSGIDLVVSSVLQCMFFKAVPDYYAIGGGMIVLLSVSLLGLWKWLVNQPDDSIYKKRLKCMLL